MPAGRGCGVENVAAPPDTELNLGQELGKLLNPLCPITQQRRFLGVADEKVP